MFEGNLRGEVVRELVRVVIRNRQDVERMMNMRGSVGEIVIEEGACNELKGDLVIEGFDHLKSIVVKKNSMKNLNSLKIRKCGVLETIETEDGEDWDDEYETYYAAFENVKNVEISSLIDLI